jgi:hypothetical protein
MINKIFKFQTIVVGFVFINVATAIFFFSRGDIVTDPEYQLGQSSAPVHDVASANKRSADVRINSVGSEGRYESQSVIALTRQQEPSINVSFYKNYNSNSQVIDTLRVDVYSITKNDLLNFLSYTKGKDDQFFSTTVDAASLQKITSLHYNLTVSNLTQRIIYPYATTNISASQ